MSAFVIKAEAIAAWHALSGVLTEMEAEGRRSICRTDPEPFTSEDPDERAEAAFACQPCPARAACRRFSVANKEPAHVWGGVDRTPNTRKRTAT